jgi:ubiquinone/menaquinone biosynthesis C-methylase UbiE
MINANTEENRIRWDKIAQFWDSHTHDGNEFHRQIVAPIAQDLLPLSPDHEILDVACSTGLFSRELASKVKAVVGIDFCKSFIEVAQLRSQGISNLEFFTMDVTRSDELLKLGEGRFDGAVCNMALMDISDLFPLFKGLSRVLKKNGFFVATLLHPSFHGGDLGFFMEASVSQGGIQESKGVKVQKYLSPNTFEQTGIAGQPTPHFCYHRPLVELVKPAFENGFMIDGIDERTFPSQELSVVEPLSRKNFPEIPSVLGIRFRLI